MTPTSIQALEWIPRVSEDQRQSFERTISAETGAQFEIRERNASGELEAPASRAEYFPVTLVEPLAGNEAAVGFDLASNPARLAALEIARDSGEGVATQRIRLAQETGEAYGFLVFEPVYRFSSVAETATERQAELLGFTLGVYRIPDILMGAVGNLDFQAINIRLIDQQAPSGEQDLAAYTVLGTDEGALTQPASEYVAASLHAESSIEVAGRTWTLLGDAAPEFGSAATAGGLGLSLAAAALLRAVVLRNRLALSRTGERLRAEESRRLEVSKLNSRLRQNNRDLEEFARAAAHDLQEPLRKIRAFSDLLAREQADVLDQRGQENLRKVQSAATRMQGLIADILQLAAIGAGEQPSDAVDLNALTRDVIATLEERIEATGARITVGDLPCVKGSAAQLSQLLQNLLGNALKYSQAELAPVIEVHGTETAEVWVIQVRDNGIGFEPKYAERILGISQRLHGRDAYEGTGIGLATCRRIAERHGGSITAKSTLGNGATFTIELPKHRDTQEHGKVAA